LAITLYFSGSQPFFALGPIFTFSENLVLPDTDQVLFLNTN
jgi:hypothetical protein